jgi:hypothetical protein
LGDFHSGHGAKETEKSIYNYIHRYPLSTMGAPKQKWTSEEEGALRAGVEKYGAGKWKTILKDPEFTLCLASRSNVDLKDKWQNLMSVSAGGQGSKTPRVKSIVRCASFLSFLMSNKVAKWLSCMEKVVTPRMS